MKINPISNPYANIKKVTQIKSSKIDIPKKIDSHIETNQIAQPKVQQLKSEFLIAIKNKLLENIKNNQITDKKEVIDISVDYVVNDYVSVNGLSEHEKAELKSMITNYLYEDPQISKKFDSLINKLSQLIKEQKI